MTPRLLSLQKTARPALLLTVGYVVVSLCWLLGSDVILGAALRAGVFSAAALSGFALFKSLSFVLATGAVLGVFLTRRGDDSRDELAAVTALAEGAASGAAFTDAAGVVRYANPAFLRLFDLTPAIIGQTTLDELLKGRADGGFGVGFLPESGRAEMTLRSRLSDGREAEIALTVTRIPQQGFDGRLLSAVDVTEIRRARKLNTLQGAALEAATDGIAIGDALQPGVPLIYVNKAFERITGYRASELIGRNCSFLQGSDRQQAEIVTIRESFARNIPADVTLRNYRKNGSLFWNRLRLTPVLDASGRATHSVGILHDVTAERAAAEVSRRHAFNDTLTSLLNRVGFQNALGDLLLDPAHAFVLVAKVDIQRFHEFNTTLGWETGDALLSAVGDRLGQAVKEAAGRGQSVVKEGAAAKEGGGEGCVGRLGSNEFGIAVPIASLEDAPLAAERIRQVLEIRYVLPGAACEPFFAIGYTVAQRHSTARAVQRQTAVALRVAQEAGFGETRRFDQATETSIADRARLTSELQQAVQNGDFVLHYQPKVRMSDGQIVGAEALVRWQHPLFGLQPPSRFIGVAEQTGMIVDIGEWVLEEASRFAAQVNRDREVPLSVAINVSQAQFRRDDIVARLQQAVASSGALASWMTLELTESIYADASPHMLETLTRLREVGFGLAIDDFGTGYSSLRYLARFPLTEIKIDRCFVTGIEKDVINRTIVEAILSMGAAKQVLVTAEGVQSEAERAVLSDLGCPMGQGYLFSIPLAEDDFLWMLKDCHALPVPRDQDPPALKATG